MKSIRHCTGCRGLLTAAQLSETRGACPYCGLDLAAETALDAVAWDPYAPPKAGLDEPARLSVPAGLGGKMGLAIRLFFSQFPLLAAVILTVWIPLNLLTALALASNPNADERAAARISRLEELVFGPICAGGVLTALDARMRGRPVSYLAAMRAGLRSWGPLFAARFVAWLLVVLGLLAMVVPGIVLSIRYALIDQVVVLEREGSWASRARSTLLTRGRRWSIFFGTLAALGMIVVSSTLVSWGLEIGGVPDDPLVSASYDSLIDVISVLITCLLFVFYWEAREQEDRLADPEAIDPGREPAS